MSSFPQRIEKNPGHLVKTALFPIPEMRRPVMHVQHEGLHESSTRTCPLPLWRARIFSVIVMGCFTCKDVNAG